MKHRTSIAVTITVAFVFMIVLSGGAHAQTYTQYRIQLNSDQSATLTITQVSGLNGSVDTWGGFQGRATSLVEAAASQTHRPMSVDANSLQMSTSTASNDSKSTDYTFTWLNFTVARSGQLVAGDVFGVNGFFDQLYGDGELQINYPANYTLESVTPTPDQKDVSSQTLEWLGTQFFMAEKPNIVLTVQKASVANSPQMSLYLVASVTAAAVVAAVVAGWFFMNSRRQKPIVSPALSVLTLPESEEEKVLRLLRSSGGATYQSAITDELRFSKAKTSQLLSALERDGKVRRVKKGRDKIVNLIEQGKGER